MVTISFQPYKTFHSTQKHNQPPSFILPIKHTFVYFYTHTHKIPNYRYTKNCPRLSLRNINSKITSFQLMIRIINTISVLRIITLRKVGGGDGGGLCNGWLVGWTVGLN